MVDFERTKPRILAVDDEPHNLQLLQRIFRDTDLVCVASGKAALALLEQDNFDVVMLDIMMPVMNGYEVLEHIRQTPHLAYLPVILVSALNQDEDIARGLQLGANDYVGKPYDIDVVSARVRTQIELKKLMDEREHMIQELKAANEIQTQFVRIASHDLKNPLNNLNLMHSILRQNVREEDRVLFELADQSILTMLDLIEQFLDSIVLNNNRMEINIQPTNLDKLVLETIASYSAAAEQKDIAIELASDAGMVLADERRLAQVMSNLVSNAIKYSPPGSVIKVDAEVANTEFIVKVIDKGPGIPEDERDKLFQAFGKLSPRPTAGESSTGLGLWIVKQLIELQNGQIGVDCPPEGGSIFWFTIPSVEPALMTATA